MVIFVDTISKTFFMVSGIDIQLDKKPLIVVRVVVPVNISRYTSYVCYHAGLSAVQYFCPRS